MKRLRRFFTPFVGFSTLHWMLGSPGGFVVDRRDADDDDASD